MGGRIIYVILTILTVDVCHFLLITATVLAITAATAMNTLEGNSRSTDSSTSIEDEFGEFLLVTSIYEMSQQPIARQPCKTSTLGGYEYVQELINGHPDRMFDSFRMESHVFIRLYETLRGSRYMQDSRGVCVEEVVAIFLLRSARTHETKWWRSSFNTQVRRFQTILTVFLRLCVGTLVT